MIKARGKTQDGRDIIILGLSRENVNKLLEDQPIWVDTEAMGIPGGMHIAILGGETEEAIHADLSKHLKLPQPGDPGFHREH